MCRDIVLPSREKHFAIRGVEVTYHIKQSDKPRGVRVNSRFIYEFVRMHRDRETNHVVEFKIGTDCRWHPQTE